MQYRQFGKTGIKISALGFGAMRLPMQTVKKKNRVKEKESIDMIHEAFKRGVNYIDTAHGYCDGQSEIVIGKAIKGWRDKIVLSTKVPTWNIKKTGDYRRLLDEQLSKTIKNLVKGGVKSSAEIALRFVLSNPNVSCALSGMNHISQVRENIKVASREGYLTAKEKSQIDAALKQYKKMADLYCTGCNYCMPCPQEVNIPLNFQLMNNYKVYDLKENAKSTYNQIGKVPWHKGKPAEACIECHTCEDKCPQKIKIPEQMKEVARIFGRK